ncbi:MAG: ATP-grasp domain-containing protein [Bacteroidota bacterium]
MVNRKKITVGVTGLNNIDSPGPGIPVIRSLKESKNYDVRIIGLSYESLEPGLYMHELVDYSYQIPLPGAGVESLLQRLSYINSVEKLDVIIPNFDAELHNFIKAEKQILDAFGIKMFLPTLEQFDARQKSVLYNFGKENGIKVPYSKMIFSAAEISKLQHEFTYPMVVKGKFYDASIAYTSDQVTSYFHKISAKWGLPVIIQQFVSGQEVNVTAIGDGNGNCIGAVPMRKLYITDKGKAWAGVATDDSELIASAKKVIKALKWKGGNELEFIRNNDGEYFLLEINPRFPAWVYLATGCGQNHPEALVSLALGDKVKPFNEYIAGKMFVRYSYDMIVDLKEYEKISTIGEV